MEKLGKLKIRFHWSFLIYAMLLIWFRQYVLLISMVVSVILHEMGHYVVAKKMGYRLSIITLMPYGASLSGEDIFVEPKHEFMIAIAGPIVSLITSVTGIAMWWIIPALYPHTNTFVYANLSIFLINLLPCFPLDGSRVLFCILKKRYPSKKCSSIVKIVSSIVIALLTVMYIVSCFTKINYSLCLFIIFLTTGLMFNGNAPRYTLISRTFSSGKKLSGGVAVNIKAISNQSTLLELYKLLEPTSLNYILVLDKANNTSKTLKDSDIEKLINDNPLDSILEKIC